jgi:hypothetical protein
MSHKHVATLTHVGKDAPDAEAVPAMIERMKRNMIVSESGCWLWQGFTYVSGYGSVSYRSKARRVHRLSFELHHGPIPPGHDVCHTCDVRNCFNPAHLWSGPRQLNNRDTTDKFRNKNSQKTHCPRGHAFAEHGRVYEAGYKGWRACIACQRGRLRVKAGWPEDAAYSLPPGTRFAEPFECVKYCRS